MHIQAQEFWVGTWNCAFVGHADAAFLWATLWRAFDSHELEVIKFSLMICFIIISPYYFKICLKYHRLIYPPNPYSSLSPKVRAFWYQQNCSDQILPQYFHLEISNAVLFVFSPSIKSFIPLITFFSSPLNCFQFIYIFWAPTSTKLNVLFQVWTHHSYEKCYHITSLSFMTQVIQSLSVLSPK